MKVNGVELDEYLRLSQPVLTVEDGETIRKRWDAFMGTYAPDAERPDEYHESGRYENGYGTYPVR